MIRSFLFVPATNERRIKKALGSSADAVVLDLEDTVPAAEKQTARRMLIDVLQQPRSRPVYVRVNALRTPFCWDDLNEICSAGPDGILLPKVESDSELRTVDWVLRQIEVGASHVRDTMDLIPIIETAAGIGAARSIAAATTRVRRLAFGAIDLALDMDLELDDEAGALSHGRFAIALASRLSGLEGPLDTAFADIRALDRLRMTALNARHMGFQGKFCIHPAQIDVVNEVFTPSPDQVSKACRIIAAFEAAETSGIAAIQLDGLMIDYPVVERARKLLRTLAPELALNTEIRPQA